MFAAIQHRIPVAVLLLTAIIAFQSLGWLMAWKGLQFGAKMEAHKALQEHGNTLIERTYHKDFIQKVKVGRKEILLDGQLFDYRVLADSGDSVTVHLYHDQKEQALFSLLGHVFNSGKDVNGLASHPVGLWLAQWLSLVFLPTENPILDLPLKLLFQKQNFATSFFKAQAAPCVFAPPPEFCK